MEGNANLNLPPVSQPALAGSTVSPGNDHALDPHSCLQLEDTLRRGKVLDIVRPFWCKVTESEQRFGRIYQVNRSLFKIRRVWDEGGGEDYPVGSNEAKS